MPSFDIVSKIDISELKNAEIMGDRLRLLGEVDSFVGRYFSQEYVKKYILHMNEDDIKREADLIKKESDEAPDDEEGGENADSEEEELPPLDAETSAPSETDTEDHSNMEEVD